MSVEFRQRTPGEYAKIAWRRKWLIILPTIAIATAIAWVVYKLPSIYESTTLVVVKPAIISTSVVAPITDVDLTLRLNNITQVVTSRSSLEPLIQKYNLYHAERLREEPIESLVQRMRGDIKVEVATSKDQNTSGFRISYRGSDPRSTQMVTAELAGKYISENTSETTNMTASTKQFFANELTEAKAQLDLVDQKRLQFMQQSIGSLPSEAPGLVGQLNGLREQQKTLITEIGRLRDSRTVQSNQLNDLINQFERDKDDYIVQASDPKTTPAYGQLAQRKATLDAQLQNMLTTLKPKNPEVKAVQNEITEVQRQMDELIVDHKTKVEEIRTRMAGRTDPRIGGIRANLQIIDGEIQRSQRSLSQIEGQVGQIEQRLNRVPNAEVGLEVLTREYQSKKAQYDSLLDKEQRAKLASNVATNQQGEAIEVVDPASLPERPVAPNRPLLLTFGLGLGLAVGLMFAALFEVPRLLTIQTTKDAEHYTGLPVLISVPELMTPREKRRLQLRHALLTGLGVVATVVSIPTLAYILKLTRVFELFVA